MNPEWTRRLKYSPLSRLAALPLRTRIGLAATGSQAWAVLRWLVRSREWANFSYDFTPQGLDAVACAIAVLGGPSPAQVRQWADELRRDSVFAERHAQRVQHTRLARISDPTLHYGRCLVRYLLVRAARPRLTFEAGTDRGLSTWAMVRALVHEGLGPAQARIVTVDIADDRGEFLEGDEGGYVSRHVGDSVALLHAHDAPIDLFIHDTVNDDAHTRAQMAALEPRLAPGAWVHSAWFSRAFVGACEAAQWPLLMYAEQPADHWYPGSRCGLARVPVSPQAPLTPTDATRP